MRKYQTMLATTILAAGLLGASSARGAVAYSYTTYVNPGGVSTPVTSYADTVNTPLTLPVYLFENLTSGSTSLINGDGGVFGGGFSVKQTTSGAGMISGIAGSVSSNGSSFAGGSSTPNPANSATLMALAENGSITESQGAMTNANSQIQMGSITITPTAPGTYTFVLDSYGYPTANLNDTATLNSNYDLDVTSNTPAYTGAIANPDTFTVTVAGTPEPATLGLLSLASLGLLARRRRKA